MMAGACDKDVPNLAASRGAIWPATPRTKLFWGAVEVLPGQVEEGVKEEQN